MVKKSKFYKLFLPSVKKVPSATLGLHNKLQIIHFILFFLILISVLIITIAYMIQSINSIEFEDNKISLKSNEYPLVKINYPLNVSAKSYIVFEKDSRVIVSSKAENLRFSPASAIKIMSAIVALEYFSPNTILTVGNLQNGDGSVMKLYSGERISVENLLYGLLLPSGNDAAQTLSQNYPGGTKAFVRRMNSRARELYMANSKFVDPSGYEDDNYSSSMDMARLASHVITNKTIARIVDTPYKIVFNDQGTYAHELINLNRLLYLEGVSGIKTGFTNEAGGVLVTSIEHKGKTFIIVVLKSEDRFADTENLIYDIVKNTDFIKY